MTTSMAAESNGSSRITAARGLGTVVNDLEWLDAGCIIRLSFQAPKPQCRID
jgi:hypothetical protein